MEGVFRNQAFPFKLPQSFFLTKKRQLPQRGSRTSIVYKSSHFQCGVTHATPQCLPSANNSCRRQFMAKPIHEIENFNSCSLGEQSILHRHKCRPTHWAFQPQTSEFPTHPWRLRFHQSSRRQGRTIHRSFPVCLPPISAPSKHPWR